MGLSSVSVRPSSLETLLAPVQKIVFVPFMIFCETCFPDLPFASLRPFADVAKGKMGQSLQAKS
jgi:hypothetical protein